MFWREKKFLVSSNSILPKGEEEIPLLWRGRGGISELPRRSCLTNDEVGDWNDGVVGNVNKNANSNKYNINVKFKIKNYV